MKIKKVFASVFILISISTLILPNTNQAQPSLSFNRLSVKWPVVTLNFSVKCGSDLRTDLTNANFRIVENGIDIGDFTVICPDGNRHCCASVALVIDKSSSMGLGVPSGFDKEKTGAKSFVDAMDGACDEACILSFNDTTTFNQFMTVDKTKLRNSIDSLRESGKSAVWDAALFGIQELADHGQQECRAVILFSNGEDNSSTHSMIDVIALALDKKIHVFTIGYGAAVNDADLSFIASQTGGKYYKDPQPSYVVSMYKDITTIIWGGFYECEIQYSSMCMDGTKCNVELTLQKLYDCPGTDTKVMSYTAPRDTTTFIPITIKLGEEQVTAGKTVDIPILLDTPLNGNVIHKSTFKILYDEQCTQLIGINSKGYLLDGVPVDMMPITSGYQFTITKEKVVLDAGVLAMLKFKTSDPEQDKECPLKLSGWIIDGGCLRPVLRDGKIVIVARQPNVAGDMSAPTALMLDNKSNDYVPNPFPVVVTVTNIGDREARGAYATLSFNKDDFVLLSPSIMKQYLYPDMIPENGGVGSARWYLYAKKRTKADTVLVSSLVTFDNHPDITMERKIFIPASPLTEVENIDSKPSAFYLGQNYPNPFNGLTTIDCQLTIEQRERASFKIYDVFGREILDVSNQIIDNSSGGSFGQLTIDNSQLPRQGNYFYRLTIGHQSQTKMMTLVW